jgi:hypothetical protein
MPVCKSGLLDSLQAGHAHPHHQPCVPTYVQSVHVLRRCWAAYCCILLLGQYHRWQQDSAMGEQNNVLHYNSVRASTVKQLEPSQRKVLLQQSYVPALHFCTVQLTAGAFWSKCSSNSSSDISCSDWCL